MKIPIITQNDFGIVFEISIVDMYKDKVDISTSTISIELETPSGLTKVLTNVTVVDAINGKIELTLSKNETSEVGVYQMYVVVSNADNYKLTSNKPISYFVKEDNGGV